MEFGVHLPDAGRDPSREAVIEVATTAERLGYASIWSSDHIAWPDPATLSSKYPYADDNSGFPAAGSPWLDCIGTLQFAAAVTERVKLGTTVLILGYRGAVQQAKGLATLDHLSNGRTIIGVGVGWMREEFEAIAMPWDERGQRADETLEIFEELFSEGTSSFQGRYQSFRDIGFSPKPARGHIPIWVGGHSPAAFRRTARYGDAFHTAFAGPELLTEQWDEIGRACERIGRPVPLELRRWRPRGGPDRRQPGTGSRSTGTVREPRCEPPRLLRHRARPRGPAGGDRAFRRRSGPTLRVGPESISGSGRS